MSVYNSVFIITLPVDKMWINTYIDICLSYPQAIPVNPKFYAQVVCPYIYRINITVTTNKVKLFIE